MNAEAILDTLADLLAERVAARLAAPPRDPAMYSSDELPPDCPSRARFHVVVKGIPGAERRGRKWFVPVEAWRDARVGRKAQGNTTPVRDDVDAAIDAAGFRATRTG